MAVVLAACSTPSATRVFSPPSTRAPAVANSPATAPSSTVPPTTTTEAAPSTTVPQVQTGATDPNVDPQSRCMASLSPVYSDSLRPPVQLGGANPSTILTIGYACADQSILTQSMSTLGGMFTPQSYVLDVVNTICGEFPQAPICVNG